MKCRFLFVWWDYVHFCGQRHLEENPHVCNPYHRGEVVSVKPHPKKKKKGSEVFFNSICWFLIQNKKQRRLTVPLVLYRRANTGGQIPFWARYSKSEQATLLCSWDGEAASPPHQESLGSGLLPGHWCCGFVSLTGGLPWDATAVGCAEQK